MRGKCETENIPIGKEGNMGIWKLSFVFLKKKGIGVFEKVGGQVNVLQSQFSIGWPEAAAWLPAMLDALLVAWSSQTASLILYIPLFLFLKYIYYLAFCVLHVFFVFNIYNLAFCVLHVLCLAVTLPKIFGI